MALEFTVELVELKNALKAFFAGRPRGKETDLECVDIEAAPGEVALVTSGLSTALDAEVTLPGAARLPYSLFEKIFRQPGKLGEKSAIFRIEAGEIRVGAAAFRNPAITLQEAGARTAELPIDAPLVDTLALTLRLGAQEIQRTGLAPKVEAARRQANELIDHAAEILGPLGIDAEFLTRVAWDRIKRRAVRELQSSAPSSDTSAKPTP